MCIVYSEKLLYAINVHISIFITNLVMVGDINMITMVTKEICRYYNVRVFCYSEKGHMTP